MQGKRVVQRGRGCVTATSTCGNGKREEKKRRNSAGKERKKGEEKKAGKESADSGREKARNNQEIKMCMGRRGRKDGMGWEEEGKKEGKGRTRNRMKRSERKIVVIHSLSVYLLPLNMSLATRGRETDERVDEERERATDRKKAERIREGDRKG